MKPGDIEVTCVWDADAESMQFACAHAETDFPCPQQGIPVVFCKGCEKRFLEGARILWDNIELTNECRADMAACPAPKSKEAKPTRKRKGRVKHKTSHEDGLSRTK